jgi:hypothetical protein
LRNANHMLGCYPESAIPKELRWKAKPPVEFLLKLMRMGHTILGITAPPPEHERTFLLGWILSLLLIIAFTVALLLFLVPRIMG